MALPLLPHTPQPLQNSPQQKILAVASTIYGASEVVFSRMALKDLERIRSLGYEKLPICIAKTHLSLSSDPTRVGHQDGFELPVESVRISAGAGYLLALTGDIVTMPGLSASPAAHRIDLSDDGEVLGV